MTVLSDRGISVDIPSGWDAEMYQRPAEEGETTNGIVHIANFALPAGAGRLRRRGHQGRWARVRS